MENRALQEMQTILGNTTKYKNWEISLHEDGVEFCAADGVSTGWTKNLSSLVKGETYLYFEENSRGLKIQYITKLEDLEEAFFKFLSYIRDIKENL